MKTIKIWEITFYSVGLTLLLILFVSGCTLKNIDENASNNITEEDLAAASQILGESLSSDNSGVLLSLTDALTNVSNDSFTENINQKSSATTIQDDRSGRGSESNYRYSYDPETGTHTVSFERIIDRPLFSKQVNDTLKYIFSDNTGAFIEHPRTERERIESINYNGRREGTINTPRKYSFFVRTDTFLIDGASDASPVMQINGVHNGNGTLEIQRPNGNSFERSYRLEINFLNIEIEKALAQGTLRRGVTGSLSWEMIIDKSSNGREESKTIRGTVELVGDGTGLLRFEDLLSRFQVNLNNGDIKDQEREFEGRVTSVNINQQTFTLQNGRQIYINEQTEIDDDDYTTLQQVDQAIISGEYVWAEGEGYLDGDRFITTEVEFENDDDNSGSQGVDFEDSVISVNLDQQTFTLAGNIIFKIDSQTEIDDSGDYFSLQEVSEAINMGIMVGAEGEAEILQDDPVADYQVIEVEFENNEEDGDDSDDSGDDNNDD